MLGNKTFTCRQLIDKLNQYLKMRQRDTVLEGGYCHGFTLLWLNLMSRRAESWLYELAHRVMASDMATECALDESIETLIAHLEWLQHPSKYQYQLNQLDIAELANLHVNDRISFLLSRQQLHALLNSVLQQNACLSISNHNHTVGVAKRSSELYLFATEFDSLQALKFTDMNSLVPVLIKTLFRRSYTPEVKLPIHLAILSCSQLGNVSSTAAIYQKLMRQRDLDVPGFERYTNLFLAAEVGDDVMVNDLLVRHADPNQTVKTWSPLHVAAAYGHDSVVKTLLKYGAFANTKTEGRLTARELAEAHRHDEVVRLLK